MILDSLKQIIDYAAEYIKDETDEWFVVKKQLVNLFPPKQRSLFSRRHYSTKKHTINDFEKEVMKYWKRKTGIQLVVDTSKLHNSNWEQKPRGWGLRAYNNKRKHEQK